MIIEKGVIPAAGLGTRLLPLTKAQPKEMLPVARKPTIQYIIEEAYMSGIREILIITGKHKRAIEDHFDKYEYEEIIENEYLEKLERILEEMSIYYTRQKRPKGLGDALRYAKAFTSDEPFVLLLGDTITIPPCTRELVRLYDKFRSIIIAVEQVPMERVALYGVVDVRKRITSVVFEIESLIEKPKPENAPSNLAILGRYVLEPEIFEYLEKVAPDPKGEIQLTDALELMVRDSKKIYGYVFNGKRYDIGSMKGWLRANLELSMRDEELKQELMRIIYEITSKSGEGSK